jgi:vacuolar-type H+-ATPase subunit E/Vma4
MSTQIEKIKAEIYNQADSELEKIKSETNEKLKIIEDATKKEVEKIKSSIEDAGKSQSQSQAKRELGKARLQAKMNYLKEKEAGISSVFEEGKKKIATLVQSSDYSTILNNLIVSAGTSLGGGDLVVAFAKGDGSKVNTSDLAQKISSKSGNQTTIKVDSSELKTKLGGVLVKKDDLWVDNSFESIIERRNESIRAEIAKILF